MGRIKTSLSFWGKILLGISTLAGCSYQPSAILSETGYRHLIGLEALQDGSLIAANTRSDADGEPLQLSLVRLSDTYNIVWRRQYESFVGGGKPSIALTPDGGTLLFAGTTLLKVDQEGVEVWRQQHSGESLKVVTAEGGDILLVSDSHIRKLNAGGGLIWEREPLDAQDFRVVDCETTGEDGLVLAGRSTFARLTADGGLQWQISLDWRDVSLHDPGLVSLCVNAIEVEPNQDIVAVGNAICNIADGGEYGFVLRLSPQGDVIWYREDRDENDFRYTDIKRNGLGGYLVSAQPSQNFFGFRFNPPRLRLMALNSLGNETTRYTFSPIGTRQYVEARLTAKPDGNLVLGATAGVVAQGILVEVGSEGASVNTEIGGGV